MPKSLSTTLSFPISLGYSGGGLPCVALPHSPQRYPSLGFPALLLGSCCSQVPGWSCLAFLPPVTLSPAATSCRRGAPPVLAIFAGGAFGQACSICSWPNRLLPSGLFLTTPLPASAPLCSSPPSPLRETGHPSPHGLFGGIGGLTSWFSQRGCNLWHPG